MRHVMIGLLLTLSVTAAAQQRFVIEGDSFMLPEMAALLTEEGEQVAVAMAMPAERRPEAYRHLDIQKGDLIPFINKRRVRSMAAFRARYEALAVGDTVMLGVRRGGGGELFILRFAKLDPANTGMVMRRVTPSGGSLNLNETRILGAERLMLHRVGGRVAVRMVLPGAAEVLGQKIEEGDVLFSINGEEVGNLKRVDALYEAIGTGEAVTLVFERGDEMVTCQFKKPQPQKGSMIMQG